jgi:transcription termination factor Rho
MALTPKNDDASPSASRAAAEAGDTKKSPRRPRPRASTPKAVEEKAAKPVRAKTRKPASPKVEQTEFPVVAQPQSREVREVKAIREQAPAPTPAPAPAPVQPATPPPPQERAPEAVRPHFEPTRPAEAPVAREQPRDPRDQPRGDREQPREAREQSQREQPQGGPARGDASRDERRDERADARNDDQRAAQAEASARSESAPPPRNGGGESQAAGAETRDGHRGPQPQPSHPQGGGGGGGGRGEWQGQQGGQGGAQGREFWKHGKRKRGRHGGGGAPWQQGGVGGGGGGGHGGREQHPAQLPPPSNAPVFGDLPNPSRFNDLAALDALAQELASGEGEALWLNKIYAMTLGELSAFTRELGVRLEGAPTKRQLLTEIFKFAAEKKRPIRDLCYIDQNDRGSFLVHSHVNYRLYPEDAYLPESLVKRYGLKRGHKLEVLIQPPQEGERCPSAVRIESVMGLKPEEIANITPFEELTPYYPLKRILLEDADVVKDVSMRVVDILTPIGFGQRGLIVAPPRTGKTVLLQNIANSISANSPEVKLILLLIDERPEEVTDFRRHTKGEVVSSTFDETPESHVHCAEMVIEIARRLIERGEHVVILLDSITRLARAYNALAGNQGKTMSGGLESNALQKPKRFFGSARNIEGGGSLTIIASALVDTGSRMDEIIFEEFKGTGNSELHLDRGLVERRIFPAVNIDRSGTRKEELLYHPDELQRIFALRRAMQGLGPIESMEMLITRLKKTRSNAEFLLSLAPK